MINELQKSIYARLSDQLTTAEVFDHMPASKDYPCVIIGDDLSRENDTDTENGFDTVLTIHSWVSDPNQRGYANLNLIMDEVYNALHNYDLTVVGYGVSGIFQDFSEKMRDSDGITRHGIQRFRIYFEPLGV